MIIPKSLWEQDASKKVWRQVHSHKVRSLGILALCAGSVIGCNVTNSPETVPLTSPSQLAEMATATPLQPTQVLPTATATKVLLTATATKRPPTATKVPPTATEVPPTATKVPPTATEVPPTFTPEPPTFTPEPPTFTPEPPTFTPEPPTFTPEPPTFTPEPPTFTPEPPTFIPTEVPPTAIAEPTGQYIDGSYLGDSYRAHRWGDMQVRAIIQGGWLVNVEIVAYPSSTQRSVDISRNAFPRLIQEAIANQSAEIDIVTRATDTSVAFINSLRTALQYAQ